MTTLTNQTTGAVDEATTTRNRDAAREIGVFLGTTFALTALSTLVGLSEDVDVSRIDEASGLGQAAMYTQAFFPLLGVLAARATTPRERRTAWGFRRPTRRALAIAWALGLLCPGIAAVICLLLGATGLDAGAAGPMLPLGLTVLVLPYVLLAIGEDLGWRGLLVTRLAQVSGPGVVVLVSGVAWAMFHWPLMIWLGGVPDDVPTVYGLASYTLAATALGAVLANMQLRWGLWPGVLMHAVTNATLYHVLAPVTEEKAHGGYLAGEVGIVGGLVTAVVALLWWKVAPLVRTADGGTAAHRYAAGQTG